MIRKVETDAADRSPQSDGSIRELAEYLGHSDPGFTLRTYIHMLPDSHERAIDAIDGRHLRPRAMPRLKSVVS